MLTGETRFDRMERTGWIDMGRIHSARVLVAGAGALGNETVKNLVLAGFRDISVADFDTVEESNLSRCVLFRERHIGRNKAEVVAESASDIDPQCGVTALPERIQSLDLSGYDIILGCLDSISARLHLNSHAVYYRIPYVDGATDGFRGKVQVILPGRPCLECSMNRTHIRELHRTYSCFPGKEAPPLILSSGITTTAVIAGICVREAIKIVCGMEGMCVRGISYYDGNLGSLDIAELEINPRCPNHGELA